MYRERAQFLDFGSDHVFAGVTVWNVLGIIGGLLLAYPVAQFLGLGDGATVLLLVASAAIGVGITIRRRGLTLGKRLLIIAEHDLASLQGHTLIDADALYTAPVEADIALTAIIDGHKQLWIEEAS